LLEAAFPDHPEAITVDAAGDLTFRIECPSKSVDKGLWLSTHDEEITIGFHTDHAHSRDWSNDGTDEHITDAIRLARDLLDERLVVLSLYWDGELGMTTRCTPEYADAEVGKVAKRTRTRRARLLRPAIASGTRLVPQLALIRRPNGATVRSWRGTYDTDRLISRAG
jgi:hypothetical protein